MFKKLVLMVLFLVSNVHATDTQHMKWTKRVKHSPALVKVFLAIVPCIITFITMDKVIVNYPDSDIIASIGCAVKCGAASIASIFSNLLLKVNFKKWIKKRSSKHKHSKVPEPLISY